MQLTTPETKDYDPVFPGENWFFFWKTSPSLWESKLNDYTGASPLLIPIYWGLHNVNPDHFDFGELRPQTDLKRLFDVVLSSNLKALFILPIAPAPFLPNGGLPSFLARSIQVDRNGMHKTIIDNDGRLNKMYSFFDPHVFGAFRKFMWHLGQYFIRKGIDAQILGLDSFSLSVPSHRKHDDKNMQSFFEDRSPLFEQGLGRYLKQLESERADRQVDSINDSKEEMSTTYTQSIKEVYIQSAKENLGGFWGGEVKYGLLGANSLDVFQRSFDLWDDHAYYFAPALEMVVRDYIPSSVLLNAHIKNSVLSNMLSNLISPNYINEKTSSELFEQSYDMDLDFLIFFQLFGSEKSLRDVGLLTYIDRFAPWCYRLKEINELQHVTSSLSDGETIASDQVFYFSLKDCDQKDVNTILKLFLNGVKVIIDTREAENEIVTRLQSFYLENDILVEKVNYVTNVEKAILGQGFIMSFDGSQLYQKSHSQKLSFWDALNKTFGLYHMEIEKEQGVFYFWKTRNSNAYELNYEEIRRVYLFNTTSYKKKVHIANNKNFAFLKSLDEKYVELKSNTLGVDILLYPGASLSLDFGQFE